MSSETDRLSLRPIGQRDVEDLFRIYGDPATNTFNPAGPYPDREYAESVLARWLTHWTDYGFGMWAITEKQYPQRIIGFGGLSIRRYADISVNNLGYRFETAAWGKGYATEFARFTLKHGFTELNLAEIAAIVRPHHVVSQNVLKKSGLKFVRDIYDVENAPPSLLFALSRQAWQMSKIE